MLSTTIVVVSFILSILQIYDIDGTNLLKPIRILLIINIVISAWVTYWMIIFERGG
jgi:hypothetical protein